MFNSAQSEFEKTPDVFHTLILLNHISLMIMEISGNGLINVLIVVGVKFSLLVPGVVSKYYLLSVINLYQNRKKILSI